MYDDESAGHNLEKNSVQKRKGTSCPIIIKRHYLQLLIRHIVEHGRGEKAGAIVSACLLL
ncbi:hypothetical protein OfM2_04060 [Lactovum odontotermitis]